MSCMLYLGKAKGEGCGHWPQLPAFLGKVSSTLDEGPSLDQGKWGVLTVFFGIYLEMVWLGNLPCNSLVPVHSWIWSKSSEKEKDHSCTFHVCLLKVQVRTLVLSKNSRATRRRKKRNSYKILHLPSISNHQSKLSLLLPESTKFLY